MIDQGVQRIFDHVLEKHELLDRNVSSMYRELLIVGGGQAVVDQLPTTASPE